MAEPFKNFFNSKLVRLMGKTFSKHSNDFDQKKFLKVALKGFEELELKERCEQISRAFEEALPNDFEKNSQLILTSIGAPIKGGMSVAESDATGIRGWASLALTAYVGRCGLPHFETSMKLLKNLTPLFSAEFDIRFFLMKNPKKTLKVLKGWTKDKDEHVRRLVSEGTRPLLPWGVKLHQFVEDPSPIFPLLELLKDDPSEYVRRSVANNLNDISKDHPSKVVEITRAWMKDASPERKKLIKHALRTLVKQGNPGALKVLGYSAPSLDRVELKILSKKVELGGYLEFSAKVSSKSPKKQPMIIDFVVHHKKANGKHSPKVFKWKVVNLAPKQTIEMSKKHAIKKITTRVYYPGVHFLELKINGKVFEKKKFDLST